MEDPFQITGDGTVVLRVHVQPGATRTALVGRHGDAVKVAVSARPERGRANEAVLALLAEVFGVAPGALELVSGASGRAKRVAIRGIGPDEVRAALGNAGPVGRVARRQP